MMPASALVLRRASLHLLCKFFSNCIDKFPNSDYNMFL